MLNNEELARLLGERRARRGEVDAGEWAARVELAACYRLVAHFRMTDWIYNHISARIPGTESFLLNPMGMTYDEICASSLIKVDLDGNVLWSPEFPKGIEYKFNYAGFVIHGAIHEAKPELHCVIHTHSVYSMAVSALKKGLLPMTQMAMRFDRVAYHPYEGVALDLDERKRMVANLGDCDVMLLRNHGALAVGRSVGEAFNSIYRLEKACRAQLLAQGADDEIVLPSRAVQPRAPHTGRSVFGGRGVVVVEGRFETQLCSDRLDERPWVGAQILEEEEVEPLGWKALEPGGQVVAVPAEGEREVCVPVRRDARILFPDELDEAPKVNARVDPGPSL